MPLFSFDISGLDGLKEAFASPLQHWQLTLWPGLLMFLTVSSFNLVGEGLRKALDPKFSK